MTDWTSENDPLPRRGQLGLLIVVLVIAAAVGIAVYVTVALGSKAANFAGGMVAHTTQSKASSDGRWSLVIDTSDEGALGGSTSVDLQPRTGSARGGKIALYDGEWLADSEVRWRDARTVSINGWLSMPFVKRAIDTGSPRTTGSAIDAAGYVHDAILPAERTVLLSGLSIVLPRGLAGQLLTRRAGGRGLPWQRLLPARGAPWSVVSLHSVREIPHGLPTRGRVIGRSRNGRVEARWNAAAHDVIVITRMPVGPIGLITERGVSVASPAAARQRVERLWRLLSVEGAKLPW